MTKKQPDTRGAGGQGDKAKALRMRAEEMVRLKGRFDLDEPPPGEVRAMYHMLHELRVQQTEMEMQNDELRQTREELETARAKYFDLYNLAPVGYFTISGQGVILEANLTAANLLGMEGNVLTGQPFTRLIVSEDQDIYYLSSKKLFETGAPQVCNVRMARPDGGLLWARIQAALAGDATGEARVYNAVIADITEAKQVEEALRRSEEKYRNLIEAAQEGIWVIDKDSRTTFANPRMAQMLGYTVEEMNGKPIFTFMDERGVEIAKKNMERRKQGISGQHDFELIKKDGARLYTAIASSPLFKGGDYIGAIAGIIDITERKAAEDRAKQFPKMLLEFQEKERARIAAELHDSLAQNMLVISNEIKLALKTLPAGSPLSEKLVAASKLALRTMDEILEIAHDLRPSHLNQLGLNKAVDSLAQRVAGLLGINIHVEIKLNGNTITPEMEINVFRIIQEGLNNIMKHSKAKNAFIDLGVSNNSLMLTITDDGKGFDVAECERGGFGIMSMIKRAKFLNGECQIKSCGEGTVISVIIPSPPPRRGAIAGPCG